MPGREASGAPSPAARGPQPPCARSCGEASGVRATGLQCGPPRDGHGGLPGDRAHPKPTTASRLPGEDTGRPSSLRTGLAAPRPLQQGGRPATDLSKRVPEPEVSEISNHQGAVHSQTPPPPQSSSRLAVREALKKQMTHGNGKHHHFLRAVTAGRLLGKTRKYQISPLQYTFPSSDLNSTFKEQN